CGQINVTGGGSGTPGPLVSIPGVYTGNARFLSSRQTRLVADLILQEPGILINIYYPVPTSYTNPGP
ncbi:hypothetical protein H0H93_015822, partial [Arthromyces matolae]